MLIIIYCFDGDRFIGVIGFVQALQRDLIIFFGDAVEFDFVCVVFSDDFVEVICCMADYNLFIFFVVDEHDYIFGVIIVDDVFEAVIFVDWYCCEFC